MSSNELGKVTLRMAIAFAVLFSIQSLCTCIVASFVNTSWDEMSPFKHTMVIIAILGNWTTTLMAFLSKTMARLEAGQPPIDTGVTGDAAVIAKTTTTVQTQTETKPVAPTNP